MLPCRQSRNHLNNSGETDSYGPLTRLWHGCNFAIPLTGTAEFSTLLHVTKSPASTVFVVPPILICLALLTPWLVSARSATPASGPETTTPAMSYVAASTSVPQMSVPQKKTRPARLPQLGVQFHGVWSHYDHAGRAKVLDQLKKTGAKWVRLDVSWAMIQPNRGSYDLRWGVPLVDDVISQARARNLKVLVMFWRTPGWANGGRGELVAPNRPSDYAKALGWAARRWSKQVKAWEVWNEPNSGDFLVGADPKTYTKLLCAAHPAVHRNDPTARVLFGGLMYNDDAWLRRAYAAGARGCFDVMAVHPYMAPADAPPGMRDDGSIWRLRHLGAVRKLMISNRDRKPIWATEYGWSAHKNARNEPNWRRGVDEAKQARYAVQAMRIMKKDYPFVKKAFWYKDLMKGGNDPHLDGYAMLRKDASPRPVFQAFRRMFG